MEPQLKIGLADSQTLTRLGLKHLLTEQAGADVTFEAASETELWRALSRHSADVVILDYDHPEAFSPATVEQLRRQYPAVNLLIISSDDDPASISQVLQQGVNSYLTKACGEKEILDAVAATARGDKFFCTRILDFLLERSFAAPEPTVAAPAEPATPLSPRELDVLKLVARGYVAKEIARELNLSTHTVYTHRKNIIKKLELNSPSEMVLYAINYGLVDTGSNSSG